MVKENCGTWGSKPPNANFSFPKSSFKFLPIFLIRIRNVRASFQKSLEHEVLDQIGCRKQRSTSVQRLEDFLGILVGRSHQAAATWRPYIWQGSLRRLQEIARMLDPAFVRMVAVTLVYAMNKPKRNDYE
jgi:hypothetical protein